MAEEAGILELEITPSGESEGQGEREGQQEQHQTLTPQQRRVEEKAYQDWIKSLREDGDSGKFARRAKDDYGRLQAIQRLEAKGYEGVKEKYDLINGLSYGDKQGTEAISAMQESLAESRGVLDAITSGDPAAFTNLNEDQQLGVSRLTPAILDHLMSYSPEAYTAALLPHFVGALRESELASSFNSLVGVLNQKPPAWLTPEQKGAWIEDKIANITQQAGVMSQWFKAQEDRLKEIGGKERQGVAPSGQQSQTGPSEETKTYWKESVYPQTNAHAETQFTQSLKPWEDRLAKVGVRLSKEKKEALAQEFVSSVSRSANANAEYKRQMGLYNKQRRPDAGSVVSTFKAEFNRHATKAMESLIRRDYGQMLEKKVVAKPNTTTTRQEPVAKGVRIVSMRPAKGSYDPVRRTPDMIYSDKYLLKDGTVVQYRP